jgi:mono/diheme cytochrome c family protein
LNKVKGVRIAIAAAATAMFPIVVQLFSMPIDAAGHGSDAVKVPVPQAGAQTAESSGAEAYAQHCAICHGDNREGILPAFPPLTGIQHQMTDVQIAELIHAGKGRMPGFPDLKYPELTALLHYLSTSGSTQAGAGAQSSGQAEAGQALFQQNCAFCHGRDAMGGETGPDLTMSKLVLGDKNGEAIAAVVHAGRPAKKMPGFNFSSQEMAGLIAFIRARVAEAAAHPGGRRGVAVEDLQTGNAEAGRQYFNGAGGCAKCHSPTGDLAGIASRFEGLKLEQRMLYPRDAQSKVTVTFGAGRSISGTLAYRDEFTIALRDDGGVYRSWPTNRVKYKIDAPVDAHAEQLPKYSDNDVHNLMAYLQTLR